jgi:hypothetical protein
MNGGALIQTASAKFGAVLVKDKMKKDVDDRLGGWAEALIERIRFRIRRVVHVDEEVKRLLRAERERAPPFKCPDVSPPNLVMSEEEI